MKTIRFNEEKDLAPIPFDERICRLALDLKNLGLTWQPHVGCFVWDVDNLIQVDSPFPGNIYFILSLPRFIEIFGSMEKIAAKLVWLPTWHQARILCQQLGIRDDDLAGDRHSRDSFPPAEDVYRLYQRISEALQNFRR